MKSLLSFCFSFLFSSIIFGQDAPQWKHFYNSHAPLNISTSSNRVAMTGGKGIMRYNIDNESIQHFNILDIPDMPTNDWSNVLENTAFNALWAVPTEYQVNDLAPIYRYDQNNGNWVGFDLDEMYNAEFDYHKLGTSPSGRVLIPGIRIDADGNEELIIAIHQSDQTWILKTVMDNPGNFSAPFGAFSDEYFIDTGSNSGVYAGLFTFNQAIDLTDDLSENYTPNHNLIDARGTQFSQSAYFINDGIKIFRLSFNSGVNVNIFEYETEDFNLPGNFAISPDDILLDRDKYFWAVSNGTSPKRLWRFKQDEFTDNFILDGYGTNSFGDWELLMTDKNSDLWFRKQNSSELWKCSSQTGIQNMNFGNSEMPLRGVTPLGLIGNHGFVFDTWKQRTTFEDGDFVNIDLDLSGEEGSRVWRFDLGNQSAAYGKERADSYFVQKHDTEERQEFHPQTEDGEALNLMSIESSNSRGDLLAYIDPYFSTTVRQYYLKKEGNDYWEKVNHSIGEDSLLSIKNFIFYDDDRLVGTQTYASSVPGILYWYDLNATSNPITEVAMEENTSALSIVKSAGTIWMYNSGKIGKMIDENPSFKSCAEVGLLSGEEFRSDTGTPDHQGNIWLATTLGRVLLWNGEEILNQFHTGNSGLQFKPEDMYLDPLNNLWMCKFRTGCTVYNEAGVKFDYDSIDEIVEEEEFNFGERPFVISPNPVRDLLTIQSTFEMNSIKIYDALGRELTNIKMDAVDYWEVNTSNWADGVYFGTINSGLNQQTFKFTKQ